MQYEDWEYHPSRLPKDHAERARFLTQLEAEFLARLRQHPKTIEFLRQYNPGCHDSFLKGYAAWKRSFVTWSQYSMKEITKGRELRYREETEDAFAAILRKKLFNTEILWRAEQLTLPGIRITWDFRKWHRKPQKCPFLEPVTAEEIDLMQQFLQTDNCSLGDLQDLGYESLLAFMDTDRFDEIEQPEWYEYYDRYMGTGHLLLLKDIRGSKEEHYRGIHFDDKRKKEGATRTNNVSPPALPYISCYGHEEKYTLSRLIDDDIFQQLFLYEWEEHNAKRAAEDAAGIYDIEDIVDKLNNIPNPPPVRAGVSWREALYHCWQDYLKGIVGDDLPVLWEELKFFKEVGLEGVADEDGTKMDAEDERLSASVMSQILNGRELAGEPRDFNF